ncbi:phosphotransferase [bacterium]|nr:phosphotransferase [bacterium]MCI0601398.1 phosphotransferase [bacterium]
MEVYLNSIETVAAYNLPEETPSGFVCTRLTGDASSRSYFRIQGDSGQSLILMKMPEPYQESNFPYLQNYELFRSAGVPLAEIYLLQPERGVVFLQDLGDFTFYELNSLWNEQTRLRFFLRSLDYLHQIKNLPPVEGAAFNTEKFLWELNYFRKYFLEGLRKIEFTEEESTELQSYFLTLATEIATDVRVFTHRDYHSRNLMLCGEEVYVIDFQDARLGPVTYDLASLCYDSYIQHSPEFRRRLEQMFFTYHPDARIERFEYPRVCLQRNLKALGTFGYQTTIMEREFYLQFVQLTLSYVKQHFQKLPEYSGFERILCAHIPELA